MELLMFVNKWLHLTSMIAILGGTIFALLVLFPTSEAEPKSELLETAFRTFGRWLGLFWLVVLATGFVNFSLVADKVKPSYHMFLGMKMTIALLMFFVQMWAAHGRKAGTAKDGQRKKIFAMVTIAGLVVIGISAKLNMSRVDGSGLKPVVAAEIGAPAGGAIAR